MRAFRVAYDGRPYRGFQRQPDVPTVEDALFDALRELGVLAADEDRPDGYAAAGRTDAGVSALAQTVAFEAPEWCRPAALNGELPADVRAWAGAEVPADFHATHDATAREYAYHWHAPAADEAAVDAVLSRLAGEHDFADCTPDDEGTVRDLATDWDRSGEVLVLRFRAGGFPRYLVRRLVALIEAVVLGDADRSLVDRALGPEPLPDHEVPGTAPPEPLVLVDVAYDRSFDVDPAAAESTRAVFDRRRSEHVTGASVAGAIRDGVDE